jgi:hypothetical protein
MSETMVSITQIDRKTREESYTRTIPLQKWYGRSVNDQLRRLVGDVQFMTPHSKPVVALGSDGVVYKVQVVK